METFKITIEETLSREVTITASDPAEAINMVQEEYYNGTIVLDSSDFDGDTQFKYIKDTE